jgi:hypothetical protein
VPLRRRALVGAAGATFAAAPRFYLLKLTDAKMLKRTPSQILADGANLAFFRQMQKELRA